MRTNSLNRYNIFGFWAPDPEEFQRTHPDPLPDDHGDCFMNCLSKYSIWHDYVSILLISYPHLTTLMINQFRYEGNSMSIRNICHEWLCALTRRLNHMVCCIRSRGRPSVSNTHKNESIGRDRT